MSSIQENPNIESGETNYSFLARELGRKLSEYEFSDPKVEYAAKVVEAEYLHEQDVEVEGDGLLSQVGTESFEQIIQGAKQEIDEETYNLGKAYLLADGSDLIEHNPEKVLENLGVTARAREIDDPAEWFEDEDFDDEYDPEEHFGVNPEYIPMDQ